MKITCYTGGFVQTNGYLIEAPYGNLLIDAPEGVADWIAERGVRVDDVLLTHQHYDHVMDAAAMQSAGARLHAFSDYSQGLTLEKAMRGMGLPLEVPPYQIERILDPGEPLRIAGLEFSLAHIPGHSPDSITFHLAGEAVVFSGDTLFRNSVGRTDLPGGSSQQLLDGIARHLMVLAPETRVLPGHGPSTTIGAEAESNPFLE